MIKIFKIPSDKLGEAKKVIENPDVAANKWARNGYTLRDARVLGFEENASYLYVKAIDDFFKENEEQLTGIEGVEEIKGEEYEKVKEKIEEEQSGAAEGIGAIFG